jgi:hypothetical protein
MFGCCIQNLLQAISAERDFEQRLITEGAEGCLDPPSTTAGDGEHTLDGAGQISDLTHSVGRQDPRVTPEAKPHFLGRVHREGRSLLLVEGAQPLVGRTGSLQADVLADDLDDVRALANFVDVVGCVTGAHASPLGTKRSS